VRAHPGGPTREEHGRAARGPVDSAGEREPLRTGNVGDQAAARRLRIHAVDLGVAVDDDDRDRRVTALAEVDVQTVVPLHVGGQVGAERIPELEVHAEHSTRSCRRSTQRGRGAVPPIATRPPRRGRTAAPDHEALSAHAASTVT
jgi:hypothetical protein